MYKELISMNVRRTRELVDPRLAVYSPTERQEAAMLSELNLEIHLQARAQGESHAKPMQAPFVVSF